MTDVCTGTSAGNGSSAFFDNTAASMSDPAPALRFNVNCHPATHAGAEISASAIFDGRIYKASQVRVERKKKVRKNQSARKRSSTNANRG